MSAAGCYLRLTKQQKLLPVLQDDRRLHIPIKLGHIDAWLAPEAGNLAAQYAILDGRERPYYAHRLAA